MQGGTVNPARWSPKPSSTTVPLTGAVLEPSMGKVRNLSGPPKREAKAKGRGGRVCTDTKQTMLDI